MGLDIYHIKLTQNTENSADYLTLDEFKNNPNFIEAHGHLITYIDHEDGVQIPVIYYEEKGYQRKQVEPSFISRFENEKLYFDVAAVQYAKTFLKAVSNKEQRELEQAFQQNFIDNFIEGESIFFISH